jgi:hypothetical protein
VRVRIHGTDLPGRDWGDDGHGGTCYENVHVGVQERRDPAELRRADARTVTWDVDIDVVTKDGELDFRGPHVQGKRGDRFVYLTWGTVSGDEFTMFRRAKLMLGAIDPEIVRAADTDGHRLVGTLGLTGGDGGPRCAAVRPPVIEWVAEGARTRSGGRRTGGRFATARIAKSSTPASS